MANLRELENAIGEIVVREGLGPIDPATHRHEIPSNLTGQQFLVLLAAAKYGLISYEHGGKDYVCLTTLAAEGVWGRYFYD